VLYAATHSMYGRLTYDLCFYQHVTGAGKKETHKMVQDVGPAEVEVSAEAEERPVDDCIREKLSQSCRSRGTAWT
jgi:hypothetical protein